MIYVNKTFTTGMTAKLSIVVRDTITAVYSWSASYLFAMMEVCDMMGMTACTIKTFIISAGTLKKAPAPITNSG